MVEAYVDAIRERTDVGAFLAADATLSVPATAWGLHGRAAIERWVHRTHIGEYGGVLATGRAVSVPMAMFFDITGDTITGIRLYYPADLLQAQLAGE
ncbi:hypothetical protein D7I44_00980 [Gryllotalpicola protaetiae]|uniref:Nuclear transport factor 2 family protein n=1 Tax=Gryllotalpicola protaetiae TaxID=2419771 RepID=A0A387BJ35_9MICO|nr:hypothetical protein D7I44_00980 [Gryllotalpicola protaetiae]